MKSVDRRSQRSYRSARAVRSSSPGTQSRPRPRRFRALAIFGILVAVLSTISSAVPSAADPSVAISTLQVSISVNGHQVTASTTLRANQATSVGWLKVCSRDGSTNTDFWPAQEHATIQPEGTAWTSLPKDFANGNYSYFPCFQWPDGSWWNGPTKTFTVPAAVAPAPNPPPATHVTKVLTVIEENHSLAQMKTGMPYLFGLAQRYGYASDYTAATHPSLPNYLAIAGGDTFGVNNDADPSAHVIHGQSIFGQALASHHTAGIFAESMSSNCVLTGNVDKGYAVKHNPWAYFVDERPGCAAGDVPATGFDSAASDNRLPNVGMLIPNKCNDAHDVDLGCNLGTADHWLKDRLQPVLSSGDFTSGALAVVITADEDDNASGNRVMSVVLNSSLDGSHTVVTTPLTHYSLSRLYSQVVQAPPLRQASSAPDLAAAFGLSVG